MKFNIFLLEDNDVERQQFKYMLKQIIGNRPALSQSSIRTFANASSLNRHLPLPSNKNIFILDLEINNNLQAGLKMSQAIRQRDSQATIIFLTVHDEFLYVSYKYRVNALDFIDKKQKTVQIDLMKDFDMILSEQQKSKDELTLTFKNNIGIFRIPINHILYFETNRNQKRHSFLVTDNNEQRPINGSLGQLADQLSEYHFYRVHRSFLVNIDNIKEIKGNTIYFFNSPATCLISRLKKRSFLSALSHH